MFYLVTFAVCGAVEVRRSAAGAAALLPTGDLGVGAVMTVVMSRKRSSVRLACDEYALSQAMESGRLRGRQMRPPRDRALVRQYRQLTGISVLSWRDPGGRGPAAPVGRGMNLGAIEPLR
ncbi:hypothetical protein [Hamadaea tsunoensis]|uniref:hypothetical protein n=1 Tax=Hamadaea tsunoensis TaxID=53368 RepID=UPI0004860AF6